MVDPEQQDWVRIIAELEEAGFSLYRLAKMTRRQYLQVKRWKEGAEPRHYEGEMLLMIHAEHVPRGTLTVVSTISPTASM